MTAGLVTSINPVQSVGSVKAASSGEGGSDFLEVFRANAGKNTETQDKEQLISEKKTETEKASPKQGEVKKSDDSENIAKTPEVKEEDATEKEDVSEEIAQAVGTVLNEIAQILEAPVGDVEEAIENLGLEATDVLDESNIPQIAVEVTGAEDAMAIMTDEKLFNDVKEISQAVESVTAELAKELGVSEDELGDVIKTSLAQASSNVSQDEQITVTKQASAEESSEDRGDNGAQMNFTQTFVENIKEAFENTQTQETGYATDMDEIYSQVSESLKLNMSEEVTEMEINLHPASLGNVKIQVAARDGMITANFVTQNEQVRAALESQIVELKDSMNEQGIKVEAIEITLASHAFEENLSKEGENSSFEGETKKKRRQINLNEIEEDDDIVIEDEIRIAREMMMHNGTTVDYMA